MCCTSTGVPESMGTAGFTGQFARTLSCFLTRGRRDRLTSRRVSALHERGDARLWRQMVRCRSVIRMNHKWPESFWINMDSVIKVSWDNAGSSKGLTEEASDSITAVDWILPQLLSTCQKERKKISWTLQHFIWWHVQIDNKYEIR